MADAERAGTALLTRLADNLDVQVAALAERGLAPDETEPLPEAFVDPQGNKITLPRRGERRRGKSRGRYAQDDVPSSSSGTLAEA